MKIIPLDEQKKAVMQAPKDLLWALLNEEDSWLKIFKVLPRDYFSHFLERLSIVGAKGDDQVRNMAKVYVQSKVKLDDLQAALSSVWKPQDLEEGTSWLIENEFVSDEPDMHLQASYINQIIKEAAEVPALTKMRWARTANGESPKLNKPPDGASPEAIRLWNRVLRDKKKRETILKPTSVEDQWGLAFKFWLSECARQDVPAYKSPAKSSSGHAKTSLVRSMGEVHEALCYGNYTMSKPASRLLHKLFDQLVTDGYELGSWTVVRPKTPKR